MTDGVPGLDWSHILRLSVSGPGDSVHPRQKLRASLHRGTDQDHEVARIYRARCPVAPIALRNAFNGHLQTLDDITKRFHLLRMLHRLMVSASKFAWIIGLTIFYSIFIRVMPPSSPAAA